MGYLNLQNAKEHINQLTAETLHLKDVYYLSIRFVKLCRKFLSFNNYILLNR